MNYSDIKIGDSYSFFRILTKSDVFSFANLVGDHNPIHVDEKFAVRSQFGKNIAHGMLVGSLFSTLVGMYCPGENSLYLSQNLNFRSPLFFEDKVEVRGTVMAKNDSVRIITLKTEVWRDGELLIDGEAKVKVLP